MAELILKKGKEKSLLRRHPWVYDTAVERAFAARGGRIACAWRGPATSLYLIGPAEAVFVGTISLDI